MKLKIYVLSFIIISLSACTWVTPTSKGATVMLVQSFNVKDCKNLGTTTATVTHKLGIIERGEDTVTEELIIVAKK